MRTLGWVTNYEHNRWFLVLRAQKPSGDELNRLLTASNQVAQRYGQPPLYVQQQQSLVPPNTVGLKTRQQGLSRGNRARIPVAQSRVSPRPSTRIEDASEHFHISIGWSLEKPFEDSSTEAAVEFGEDEMEKLGVAIQAVKVKVGNGIVSIPLGAKTVESKGMIGM